MHFFISYAKKDTRKLATELYKALNQLPNVTAWMDESLEAGLSWELQIQKEIRRCDFFIVFYSPDINRHINGETESYVLNELAYAKYVLKKRIIPVMAQETEPPISMVLSHYVDYARSKMSMKNLLNAILKEVEEEPTGNSFLRLELSQAIDRAFSFTAKRNRDWQPYYNTFHVNGISLEMCLVPVGHLTMGNDFDGYYWHGRWKKGVPNGGVHKIEKPFWISRYPITNTQWREAVRSRASDEPEGENWYRDTTKDHHPVVGVTWYQARKFAEWVGCTLPTSLQWEYAARGVNAWVYPWGNIVNDMSKLYINKSTWKRPYPAEIGENQRPEGQSWVGAHDMSGNTWEWCSSAYTPYPYNPEDERHACDDGQIMRVIRGGAWNVDDTLMRSATYFGFFPDVRSELNSFRLVRQI
jgi:formylglycine-generating enzyme required for sulfatase activity